MCAVPVLSKGQNAALGADRVRIRVTANGECDLSALLVTEAGKVRTDADFVFFNQPNGPGVTLESGQLVISTPDIPADISQVRAVLTLAAGTFGQVAPPVAIVSAEGGAVLHSYSVVGLTAESIVIALEVYRRAGGWKVRAVGQGYAGGFAELVTDHGVVVDDEPSADIAPAAASTESGVRTVAGESGLSLEKRQKLDLRKRAVAVVLTKKGASGVRARVVLVIDKTGSMSAMYKKRVVHRVVERMVPVAIQVDDDGRLEPYLYGVQFARLPDIDVLNADAWCAEFLHLNGKHGGIDYKSIGGYNDEIPILTEIISSLRPGDPAPTFVLFFTDGGFHKRAEITQLMRRASGLPAFWQFVGLGGRADYGVLRKLDEMDGRIVDNCGFFALDDVDAVSDEELYQRLLSEFPDWLRAAMAAGIVGR